MSRDIGMGRTCELRGSTSRVAGSPRSVDLPFACQLKDTYAAYGPDVRAHLARCEQVSPEQAVAAARLGAQLQDRVRALFADLAWW